MIYQAPVVSIGVISFDSRFFNTFFSALVNVKNYSVFFFSFLVRKKSLNVFRRVHYFSLHERRDLEGDIFIAIQKIQLFSTFYPFYYSHYTWQSSQSLFVKRKSQVLC